MRHDRFHDRVVAVRIKPNGADNRRDSRLEKAWRRNSPFLGIVDCNANIEARLLGDACKERATCDAAHTLLRKT